MTTVKVFAPAKINLSLHVTGRRSNGYHDLDSLVAFLDVGDTIIAEPAESLTLDLSGPVAAEVPANDDNLVLKAARLLECREGARITLIKHLPVASGIGGGSADAAATVRALCSLWQKPWPEMSRLAQLGADIPVCMQSGFTHMRGIGDQLDVLGPTPELNFVLINPSVAVPTPTVFEALQKKDNAAIAGALPLPRNPSEREQWISWIANQRNDLEAPAIREFPVIDDVLAELRGLPGCLVARMSGSGATCLGIYRDKPDLAKLTDRRPNWWITQSAEWPVVFTESEPGTGVR
ncbi:MAG: 4-(cytidine 5'-diphospho)-2-C-methyl-D-erythritol kinase [Pseudomonadota bacterium]